METSAIRFLLAKMTEKYGRAPHCVDCARWADDPNTPENMLRDARVRGVSGSISDVRDETGIYAHELLRIIPDLDPQRAIGLCMGKPVKACGGYSGPIVCFTMAELYSLGADPEFIKRALAEEAMDADDE